MSAVGFEGFQYYQIMQEEKQTVRTSNMWIQEYCADCEVHRVGYEKYRTPAINGTLTYEGETLHYLVESNRIHLTVTGGPACQNYNNHCLERFAILVVNRGVVNGWFSAANDRYSRDLTWNIPPPGGWLQDGTQLVFLHMRSMSDKPNPIVY